MKSRLSAPVPRKLRNAARTLRDHGLPETASFLETLSEKEKVKVTPRREGS